jgi:hypothetical protein
MSDNDSPVTVKRVTIDPDDPRVVHGATVRFDPVGCDCGTCGSTPFLYVSDGEVLLSVTLTPEQVRVIQSGAAFMLGGES